MGEWDVRLLSASYRQDGEEVAVELFGKTRDQESITILCYGFKTYFYVVKPREELASALKKDGNVISVEEDKLFYKGENVDVLKITIKYPWLMSDFRNRLKGTYRLLAADIGFADRFIYDNDIHSCIHVKGEEIQKEYSTKHIIKMDSFENIDSFDPGLKILSFDIENSVLHGYLLTICSVVYENGKFRNCEAATGNETEIIKKFSEIIQKEDPDVITGYNIDNYDIDKITERAKIVKCESEVKWGRDYGIPKRISERFWKAKGRLIVDAWWAVRRELRPKQETLNAVSMQLFGESKLDVDPKNMDSEWKKNSSKVIEYCFKDAELALKILLHVGTVRKGLDLAAVSYLPVEDVLTSGTSTLADSLLIRKADREKIGVPMTGKMTRTDQIEGGYVHSMTPGLYHWVCVLDFKSMYPSLIISKNICFTTLSPDGEIVSPDGTRYLSKKVRVGLLPRILEGLMKQRDDIKKAMKSAKDENERHYLDGLQAAVKVLMNTFYGVFASSFYRFTDKSIGASITAFARATTIGIIKEVENEGVSVIYSDTDSIFMQSPANDLDGSVKFGNKMAERFTKEGGILEFEKILEPMFTHGMKKRYVGKVVWPKKEDDLLVRGYEIRRSDSFDLQSNLLTELFNCILEERNEDAVALVRKTVQDTLAGKVPVSELVISKGCRDLNAYENPDRMANVQTAKKLIEMGYEFTPGMKVSWIVTDSSVTPQKVEPYISGVEFKEKPDYRYYAERIAQTASRITEVFGWSEKEIMTGSQQATLFDTSFGRVPSEKKKEEKKEKPRPKSTKLSDFF